MLSDLRVLLLADNRLTSSCLAVLCNSLPLLERLQATPTITDPIQAYCDLLYHRYLKSAEQGRDIGTEAAFKSWLAAGQPGPMIP